MPLSIMAIINATPDSFSDGGENNTIKTANDYAEAAIKDGALFLDIGGESTRPNAERIGVETELKRVIPLISSLKNKKALISIDTSKAAVAEQAIKNGATWVNDVTAGNDEKMFQVVKENNAGIILMHMQGSPKTMQENPAYDNVVDDVIAFLKERSDTAIKHGIPANKIMIDPGFGFGKTKEHNLLLLQSLSKIQKELNYPLVIGISRKSLIPSFLERDIEAKDRDLQTAIIHTIIASQIDTSKDIILRVHDTKTTRDMIKLLSLIEKVEKYVP